MSAGTNRGILGAIAIAAVVSLAITVLRLCGELNDWNATLFNPAGGGGGSPLGITWLVPVFGFWFGRRLASGGQRPRSVVTAAAMPVLGIVLAGGLGWLAFGTELVAGKDDLTTKTAVACGGAAAFGLLLLVAWPRAWIALAGYGALARAPVLVIQNLAFARGWHTHFNSGGKNGPQDPAQLNRLLTIFEGVFWPFGFTVLVGGLFAAIGAATVRRSAGDVVDLQSA
jgi:hypothetical protein